MGIGSPYRHSGVGLLRAAIGTVSEAHVLRTYGEELERRNQELFFR